MRCKSVNLTIKEKMIKKFKMLVNAQPIVTKSPSNQGTPWNNNLSPSEVLFKILKKKTVGGGINAPLPTTTLYVRGLRQKINQKKSKLRRQETNAKDKLQKSCRTPAIVKHGLPTCFWPKTTWKEPEYSLGEIWHYNEWLVRGDWARKLTLTAVDDDEWIFQIWSGIESQRKSQDPGDPHGNCHFQHNQRQASLVWSRHVALPQREKKGLPQWRKS